MRSPLSLSPFPPQSKCKHFLHLCANSHIGLLFSSCFYLLYRRLSTAAIAACCLFLYFCDLIPPFQPGILTPRRGELVRPLFFYFSRERFRGLFVLAERSFAPSDFIGYAVPVYARAQPPLFSNEKRGGRKAFAPPAPPGLRPSGWGTPRGPGGLSNPISRSPEKSRNCVAFFSRSVPIRSQPPGWSIPAARSGLLPLTCQLLSARPR